MVVLSAKEKWLIDAGASMLAPPQRRTWANWGTQLQAQLATANVVQIPTSVAEIALSALEALADRIKHDLEAPGLADQEEDHLFNDLEATQQTITFIARDLGHQPSP
jgi:hypothetical protein